MVRPGLGGLADCPQLAGRSGQSGGTVHIKVFLVFPRIVSLGPIIPFSLPPKLFKDIKAVVLPIGACPDLSGLVRICPALPGSVRACQDLSGSVPNCPEPP
jgi:hypothetical protein